MLLYVHIWHESWDEGNFHTNIRLWAAYGKIQLLKVTAVARKQKEEAAGLVKTVY